MVSGARKMVLTMNRRQKTVGVVAEYKCKCLILLPHIQ